MSITVEKKSNETPAALADRFSREVRRSGVLRKAKKNRYHQRAQNSLSEKRSALKKVEARQRYFRLKKLGQV